MCNSFALKDHDRSAHPDVFAGEVFMGPWA
jgi:hypothetical protein